MKVVTAHQSSYLPWLGFFHKIAISDIFIILDDVQFEKNSFSNRNKIKGPNGTFWLTVPVRLKGHMQKKIMDIEIINNSIWRKKHLKAIENCYAKAPYFNDYIPFFRDCYSKDWDNLTVLNEYILSWFLKQLDIDVKVYKASDHSFKGQKSDLILEICRKFEAEIYVFGTLGKDYADVNWFVSQGVKVYFQDYKLSEYQQLYLPFVSNLSIVDLLFNCGPASHDILMRGNIQKMS